MKIKLIILALCSSLILATVSCNKVKPRLAASMDLYVSDTSVSFYHTAAFSKNKKQQIILAFWDNMPRPAEFESGPAVMNDPPDIECSLTKSNSNIKFECVGEFDGKTGKWEIKINGESFDVSNGRLFLINTHVKPVKVIQVNEQFNLPPFNDLSSLDDFSIYNKSSCLNVFSSCKKKFEYLAKNNKVVAAFLAESKKHSEKNKTKDSKKKD